MVKQTETIRRQPSNCLSVFGNFVGLELKGLMSGIGALVLFLDDLRVIGRHEQQWVCCLKNHEKSSEQIHL